MKIGVLGSGLMGKEVARDLVNSEGVVKIGLADIDLARSERVVEQLNSPIIKAYQVDASDKQSLTDYMKQYDVIINALFYSFNEIVAKTAIEVGVSSVDLGGHIGNITDKVLELNDQATTANVTIVPDLGVAPGMINILAGHGVKKLDKPESVRLFVGGIPLRPEPPLEYNHVFSMEGMFDHYTDPSLIIRKGEMTYVPSLSEVEEIHFAKFGPLEAFHTSGGTSTLSVSYPDLKTLEYKTIRYQGHAEKFQLLIDLNLTRHDYEVDLDGQKISPRDVLLKVLDPIVELGDKEDVVLLKVIVSGEKDGKYKTFEYEMITYKDVQKNITAMARATTGTISTVAQLIANGTIKNRGVIPPEQAVPGDIYIKEMNNRGVKIVEIEK